MPRGDVARQIGLYTDHAAPGCMGGMLNMFDWNSALLGKKLLTDPDFNDGIEAPRNSLDTVSGTGERGQLETPKGSSVKKEDVPFSVKLGKGNPSLGRDSPKDPPRDSVSLDGNDKRRRSTSVVARLMGLDPLPDATTSQQQQQPPSSNQPQQPSTPGPNQQQPKVSKDKLFLAQRLLKGDVKDVKVVNPTEQVKVPQSDLSTPRLSVGSKAAATAVVAKSSQQRLDADLLMQLPGTKEDAEDFKYSETPAREHPQEKQLQEFKKQFATKLAIQSHENRQRSSASVNHRQSDASFNHEVEVKRIMVEEKMMNEAAILASKAGGDKNDPKRLAAALDKLNKSKEFQEVLEVLQSNKEFFLKFLQEPNAILLDKHQQQQVEEDIMYTTPPQPVEVLKKPKPEAKSKDSSEKRSKGGISPSSFARRFMESRRGNTETKQKKSNKSSSTRNMEDDIPTPSTSASTPRASFIASLRDSRPLTGDRELSVRTSQQQQQTSAYDGKKQDPFSPGKIVLLRPGSNDSPEISSPSSLPNFSPRNFRAPKESKDSNGGYGSVVESRLSAEQQLYRESRSSMKEKTGGRHSVDSSWANYAVSEEVAIQRVNNNNNIKESARLQNLRSTKERERSKESRDIARDIIREARAGIVRELGRAEVSPRASSGEVTLTRNGSTGRRITLLRMSADSGDVTGSSDGEATPTSARGLRSGSATGLSSPASARTVRSQDSVFSSFTGSSSKLSQQKRRERAALEKEKEAALLAVQLEEQQHHLQQKGLSTPRKSLSSSPFEANRSSSPRRSSSQTSSKVLRKAIVGSLLETQVLSDSRQLQAQQQQLEAESLPKSSNEKMLLPKLLPKGERVVSNIPSEDESAVNSPRNLQRCRSVPNAALRAILPLPEQPHQQQQTSQTSSRSSSPFNHQRSHEAAALVVPEAPRPALTSSSSSKPFSESCKRGVEAVGSLFARAKSKERNKIFVRSRKKSQSDYHHHQHHHESSDASLAASEEYHHQHREGSASYEASEIASPLEWSGRLNLPPSHEDSEAEASEISDVKRMSVCSDAASYELQQSKASGFPSRPVAVEQDSIHAPLSMSAPRGQVRINADMATDQCDSPMTTAEHCNSPMAADLSISPSPRSSSTAVATDVLEVPAAEQTPRSRQFGSLGTEDSRNDDEDPLEVCDRKSGQPSPISVLDSPFEELDSPSPEEFKEITSDLQELRLRLRLLKLDEDDRARPSLDSTLESDPETPQVEQRCGELMVRGAENSDCCQQSKELPLQPESSSPSQEAGGLLSAVEAAINRDRALLESIDLEGFSFPEGRREELVYVRDLLVASEFVQSPAKVFTRWHSPNQPLDPILFENLEDYYNGCQPPFGTKDGRAAAEFVVKLNHRLLFDAVNDVLFKKLGPYMTFHPWVQPSTPLLLRPMPSGRQLVMETWTELCSSFPSGGSDASNSLLERDLSKGKDWMCQRQNLEQIGLELEREILGDLLDETVMSLSLLIY